MHEDIASLICDSLLKTYIVERKISRWKTKDSCSNFIEKVDRLFEYSNKHGNAVNAVNIKKGDLGKSRMSSDLLQKHIALANVLTLFRMSHSASPHGWGTKRPPSLKSVTYILQL